jgi:hypothetical protein
VIGITETWLDDTVDNNKLFLTGYLPPIRKDRSRQGGGVCVYIHNDFAAKHVCDIELYDAEVICIEYRARNRKHLLCFRYKPPDSDIIDYLVSFDSIFSKSTDYDDIMFMGDFNCKLQYFCVTDRTTTDGRILKHIMILRNLLKWFMSQHDFKASTTHVLT